ncbi:TPA: helix-turn-helix domain-containing protein [Photobacterium damselae]
MSFSLYLKKILQENKLTRNELIARLNLSHEIFSNLDAITFSRWITNKTTPSPYKQALIAQHLGDDVIEFMKYDLTIKKESKTVELVFDKLMTKLEKSYSNISYFYNVDSYEYLVDVFDNQRYEEKFSLFYKRFKLYDLLKNGMKKINIACVFKTHNNLVASHVSFFKLNECLASMLSDIFNTDLAKNRIFINVSYIDNRDSYFFMISVLLYCLYKKSEMFFYCAIREDFLEYMTSIQCEQIGNVFIDNGFKVYLLKIDLINVMVNQFVRNFFLNEIDRNEIFFKNSLRKIENYI